MPILTKTLTRQRRRDRLTVIFAIAMSVFRDLFIVKCYISVHAFI